VQIIVDLLLNVIGDHIINAKKDDQNISKQPKTEILNKIYIRPVPNLITMSL